MMGEWRRVKLGDLGEVNRGRSRHRPRDAAHLYGGPYPFIQTGDIKASTGRITRHSQTYSEAGLKQFPAYLNRWDSQQARNEGVFAH